MSETKKRTRRIAIVEDEAIFVMLLNAGLPGHGFEIAGVETDADRALEVILRESPDAIVLDIALSGTISGIELAHRLRDRIPVPILFLSGYPRSEFADELAHLPGVRYLTKPATVDAVATELHKLLDDD